MKINGVKVKEVHISDNKNENVFEFQFKDEEYVKELIHVTFKKVDTQYGHFWMFVIRNKSFFQKKGYYYQALSKLHEHVVLYLIRNFTIQPELILIDHESQLFQGGSFSSRVSRERST